MKSTERLIAIYDDMARLERQGASSGSLCSVAKNIVQLTGAGITVEVLNSPMMPLCSSNEVSRALLDLEVTLGEGPCTAALHSEIAVDQPDLSTPMGHELMAYAPMALAIGVQAVFGFPVRIGVVQFGALGFYRDRPGALSESQRSDGYLMASVVGRTVLAMQSGADSGTLSVELRNLTLFEFSVHQASGIVAVQGAMSIKDALISLRMHAHASEISLAELSARVIARRVRFDAKDRTWTERTLEQ